MSVEVHALGHGFAVRFQGSVSTDIVIRAVEALGAQEGFVPDSPTLWDFSSAQGQGIGADEMRAIAARVLRLREGAGRPRVGLLMRSDADFGSARMFIGLNEARLPNDLRIFRDSAEAYAWTLGVSPHGEAVEPEGGGVARDDGVKRGDGAAPA